MVREYTPTPQKSTCPIPAGSRVVLLGKTLQTQGHVRGPARRRGYVIVTWDTGPLMGHTMAASCNVLKVIDRAKEVEP